MSVHPYSDAATLAGVSRPRRAPKVESKPVTLRRAIDSEWIKFRTLRSSWAILGGGVLAMLILGLAIALHVRHLSSSLEAGDIAPSGTLQGYLLVQLLIGSLGVLYVSGEYGTGMIRSTLTAIPKRVPDLWAKLIVLTAITAVTMTIVSIAAFLLGQGVISSVRPAFSLSSDGALRVVLGTGVYLTLIGVIGMALGWIVRSTAGGLMSFASLVFVVPLLFGEALGNWGKHVAEFFPTNAGAAFISSVPEKPSLSPWVGLAVMAVWALVGIAVAYGVLRKRDA